MTNAVSPEYRSMLNRMAGAIDTAFNQGADPKQTGFALLLFRFGEIEAGTMNWISNAERKDMLTALKEMVAQLEGRVPETSNRKDN